MLTTLAEPNPVPLDKFKLPPLTVTAPVNVPEPGAVPVVRFKVPPFMVVVPVTSKIPETAVAILIVPLFTTKVPVVRRLTAPTFHEPPTPSKITLLKFLSAVLVVYDDKLILGKVDENLTVLPVIVFAAVAAGENVPFTSIVPVHVLVASALVILK